MSQINLLLLCGGGGSEHDISLMSADYLEKCLTSCANINLLRLTLDSNGHYFTQTGARCSLTDQREIQYEDNNQPNWQVDYVIPCIHGYPGETGDIQSYFNLIQLPYFGCGSEASINCFNKVTAKMWFSALGIPNTPYLFLTHADAKSIQECEAAFEQWGGLFIKAATQGSSVGCYQVNKKEDIANLLVQAFELSEYVIVEKTIKVRELEVAAYEYQGNIVATLPGEIICPDNNFYSFDEKYATNSQSVTHVEAPNLTAEQIKLIRHYAILAFKGMKLRHLSRIDFFLTDDNEILLNEINTFPGMTPISMFPKMLQHNGDNFTDYLLEHISK